MPSPDGGAKRPDTSPLFDRFQAVNLAIETAFAYIAGAFLALFTVVVLVDVIYRQLLQSPMMWPSEWSVMSFIWSVMLGASVAARRNSHFVVELFPDSGGRIDTILKIVVALLGMSFGLVILYFGCQMSFGGLRRVTPMMGYRMVYVFSAFPVAGAAITLFTFEDLLRTILHRNSPDDDDNLKRGGVL